MSDIITQPQFQLRDLSVIGYAQGFTHWHYRTDAWVHATHRGYFDAARELVSVGDVITVSGAGGACLLCVTNVEDRVLTVRVS